MADTVGVFISGLLLVAVYSYLFKDSQLYRHTEHIYVGFAAAHAIVMGWENIKEEAGNLFIDGDYLAAIPLILGLLLYTRFNDKISYLGRTSLAFMMGVAAGVTITGCVEASFVKQIRATILPLNSLNNIVMVVGTISTLSYFLFIPFKRDRRGKLAFDGESAIASRGALFPTLSILGRTTMMVAFGSSFGFVVMARLSYLVGRLQFLFSKCIPIIK